MAAYDFPELLGPAKRVNGLSAISPPLIGPKSLISIFNGIPFAFFSFALAARFAGAILGPSFSRLISLQPRFHCAAFCVHGSLAWRVNLLSGPGFFK